MAREESSSWGMAGFLLLAAAIVVLAQLSGCGGSGGGAASVGTLQVRLTDAPSDDYEKVVVAIKEVRVVPSGMDNAADDDSGLPVVVKYETPHVVDILTLRFQQELLGSISLPAGTYNQIRLILEPNPSGNGQDPVNYLTLKTAPTVKIPLTTPSGQQSGLKVLGKIEVTPNVINAAMIDFDPDTAIVVRGNGDYNLKPTGIRIIQTSGALSTFGSLSGTVFSTLSNWSTATVSVVPQGSSTPAASGAIFSSYTGNRWQAPFSAFVPGGTYRVHVQATGFAPYSSALRTVTTGADTALGDVPLVPLP